jgi:hypothetical protein
MTPLLSASVASLFRWQMDSAYFVVGVACSAILLPAIGYLLYMYFGVPGLFALLIGLLLKFFWPDNGIYPFQTARVPFVIYLVVTGLLIRQMPILNRRTQILFLTLGILNGLLGLWHGASFFTATTISGILVMLLGYYSLRNHYTWRALILTVALFCVGFIALFGLLIVPQLIHYGRLMQNESARLWLDDYYQGGNVPSLLFSLSLRPRGLDSLFFVGFLLAMWSRKSKEMLPLLIGYILCKALAHLGFILHSTDYPQLAMMSAKLLPCPPHTFNDLGNFLLVLIKFSVVGFMLLHVARFAYWIALKARLNQAVGAAVLASVGYIILAYQLLSHLSVQAPLYAKRVDQVVVDFAWTVSETIGQSTLFSKDGQYEEISLYQFAPVKLLFVNLPEHTNPYVESQRRLAQANTLRDPKSAFDNGVKYVLSATPTDMAAHIAQVCGAALAFEAPNGYKLWRLERPCSGGVTASDVLPAGLP